MEKDGQRVTHIVAGYAAHWSPDGSTLVFMRGPEKGNSQQSIWVASADGKETKQAVQGDLSLQDAKWLPDGKGIVCSSLGTENNSIFLSRLNGAQPREIENDKRYNWFDPTISPDGKQLVVDVKCLGGLCTDVSPLDPSSTSILIVYARTHQQKFLAHGMRPSIVWSKN
jgi:Tol biopolymer transport system component